MAVSRFNTTLDYVAVVSCRGIVQMNNNVTSHQIDLAAFPQCNNVRVLLEHALQVYKDNRCKDSLKQAQPT